MNQGFSLIEVIAAVGIFVVGLIGISALSIQNMRVQYVNNNNLIASMLAQEGLEIVRGMRDQNWVSARPWNAGFTEKDATINFAINYQGVTTSVASIDLPAAGLYVDNIGLYTSTTTFPATPFHRLITVTDKSASSSAVVTSLVRWEDGSRIYDYAAETMLFDWR